MIELQTLSMVELRKEAERVIRRVSQGERFLLTYRGKPVARLEPVRPQPAPGSDAFYRLHELADARGRSLTNDEIDEIVYGE